MPTSSPPGGNWRPSGTRRGHWLPHRLFAQTVSELVLRKIRRVSYELFAASLHMGAVEMQRRFQKRANMFHIRVST